MEIIEKGVQMSIFELVCLLGVVIAVWNLVPKSNRNIKKFGNGLLSDADTNNFPKNHIP
jgi:hypothetical protein